MSYKILVVDDEPDIANTIGESLKPYMNVVDIYNLPQQALEKFKPGYYDAAILDIRMPDLNGFMLSTEMRKVDPDLKICFLTAYDNYEIEFKKLGFSSIILLKKPVSMTVLREKLVNLIEKGKA